MRNASSSISNNEQREASSSTPIECPAGRNKRSHWNAMAITMSSQNTEDVFDPFLGDSFDAENFVDNEEEDRFDPFHVGEVETTKTSPTKSKHQDDGVNHAVVSKQASSPASVSSRGSVALPPRIVVKFRLHEEVSSSAILEHESEGASNVFIQGTLLAQVTSSDAFKNAPFVLIGTGQSGSNLTFTPNDSYSKVYSTKDGNKINVVKVRKAVIGFVPIGSYSMTDTIAHMPLLLERKVTKTKKYILIAVQIRSKLTNQADLSEFSVGVVVPEQIDGGSVEIMSGEGVWDGMKRSITWKLPNLAKGESFMVSARAKRDEGLEDTDDMKFPVMLRCTSSDQISTAQFQAVEASGHPASVAFSTTGQTFRMIHRLK